MLLVLTYHKTCQCVFFPFFPVKTRGFDHTQLKSGVFGRQGTNATIGFSPVGYETDIDILTTSYLHIIRLLRSYCTCTDTGNTIISDPRILHDLKDQQECIRNLSSTINIWCHGGSDIVWQ